jgi:hypothetical protein
MNAAKFLGPDRHFDAYAEKIAPSPLNPQAKARFFDIYAANFGDVPEMKTPGVMALWGEFLETIDDRFLEPLFEQVTRLWKPVAYKPKLHIFKKALKDVIGFRAKAETDKGYLGADFVKYDHLSTEPLFNFKVAGFPKRREALVNELPRNAYREVWATFYAMLDKKIEPEEAQAIWNGCFQPKWADYDDVERTALRKRWLIAKDVAPDPVKDEVPF